MSFSKDSKIEALENWPSNDCCWLSFLHAIFLSAGEIQIKRNSVDIILLTDLYELYDVINKILKTLYGDYCELEIEENYIIGKKTYYKIIFPKDKIEEILRDCGNIEQGIGGNLQVVKGINKNMINDICCKKSFIKGAFVGCATSSIKISNNITARTSSGYHLEFTSHNYDFLQDLAELFSQFELFAKIVVRKNKFVLYFKEATQVADVLAIVESFNSVLVLQNEIVSREIRNKINRETNCVSANISKTIDASLKQLYAIERIKEVIGLDALAPDLEEVALLRLANQEESLEELLRLSTIKLTKSGLNYRFKKIIRIAEELTN